MLNLIQKFKIILCLQYINVSLSKAGAIIPLRKIDASLPNSWEFSAFSQSGEDGIIDYLADKIIEPNRYFIEIGSENGLENNTSWLAIVKKYSGLMIEGREKSSKLCKLIMSTLNIGVDCRCVYVTKENIKQILKFSLYTEPDVFSLDIDGNDYYIAKAIMETGFRPKIFIVEYNSVFGPDRCLTVKYNERFDCYKAHKSGLYYGASISGWKRFFKLFGYKFVTVNLNGTNAFFINPDYFDKNLIDNLKGLEFLENFYHLNKFKITHDEQFKLVADMDYEEI